MELSEQTFTRVRPDLSRPVRLRAEGFGELEDLLFESAMRPYGDFARQRVAWVAEAAAQHIEHCTEYARLVRHAGFCPDDLLVSGDLARVPLLSSSIFKKRHVSSLVNEPIVWCSSSGTSGTKSVVARDHVCRRRPISDRRRDGEGELRF